MAGFTVAKLARIQSVRRRGGAVFLQPIELPKAIDRELFLIYMRAVRLWWKLAKSEILPEYAKAVAAARLTEKRMAALRADAEYLEDDTKEGGKRIGEASGMVERLVLTLTAAVSEWAFGVEEYHREKFVGAVYTATSVNMATVMYAGDVQTTLEAIIERNMSLIRNVSEQTRQRIAEIFFRHYQLRTPLRQVAKEISEAVGLARDRALRIASDQTTKLASALDEQRMREAGITEFQWVHSRKENYRPEHKARDGRVYKWATARSVLKGDLPGVAINCGCKAKAIVRF